MTIEGFLSSFWAIICGMSPYLLLGFLIAGVLHVFVPKQFYKKYLSNQNRFSVLYAALLGVPLPLCSCGVIPTAIGLKNEKASKGAVASFLIATPQTGIDSILATYSLMGLGFAIIRPVAALVTGVCGGLLINRFANDKIYNAQTDSNLNSCSINTESTATSPLKKALDKVYKVLKYAYFDMIQDIGLRLFVGLLLATIISVAVPDEFFLRFSSWTILQMLVILAIAVPMYICSTGSIPIAAALIMKGLSPGAALVMLMAGPAVNVASILVVKKSLGTKFTIIYLSTIVVGAMLFGLLVNAFPDPFDLNAIMSKNAACDTEMSCCDTADTSAMSMNTRTSIFRIVCSILLLVFIVYALTMKYWSKFFAPKEKENLDRVIVYNIEGMHCNHCRRAVEEATMKVKGVTTAETNVGSKTLTINGNPKEEDIRKAVEEAGFTYKGIRE
jgi:uncharacterized protein